MSDMSTQTEELYFGEQNSTPNTPQASSAPYTTYKLPPTIQLNGTDTSSSDELKLPPRPSTTGSLPSKPIALLTAKLYKLPLLDQLTGRSPASKPAAVTVQSPHSTEARWAGSDPLSDSQKQELEQRRSLSQPSVSHKLQALSKVQQRADFETEVGSSQLLRTPRTVESTRRMMQIFNRFSRSESMRRFHQHYKELAPDLRELSIQQGKRHIIHGKHAYYYH